MQIIRELRYFRIRLNKTVRKLDRVRCRESNPVDAVDGGDIIYQRRKIGDLPVVHRTTVCVDVLSQQVYLANALRR